MSRKLFLIVTLSLLSVGTLGLPQAATADTPLTRATVQALRNQVQLIFKNRMTRAARNTDTMTPGDSLATARKSFAELRFNDSSIARIGERALFQFVPNTRNFYLGNGTALLLIPPGQGRTNVRTPNAAAGIRGSALFVRYNEDTNTTIVGALTNSRIEVSNGETTQAQTLKAGQMAVIVQNQVVQVYNFDLNTFYQTSELVKDLDLPLNKATPNADPGMAAVQAETSQAARAQAPLTGQVSENPAFVSLTPPPSVQTTLTPTLLGAPTPSGLDLRDPPQAILPTGSQPAASPDLQPSPPNSRPVVPGIPTLSTPVATPTQPIAPPSTPLPAAAIVAPSVPSAIVTPTPTSPPLIFTPGSAAAPTLSPPTTAPAPTLVTPSPTIVTPPPTSAPAIVTPTPSPTLVTPTPAPVIVTPTPAPAIVTPTPAPTLTAPTPAPAIVAPTIVTPTPAPVIVTPTPAPAIVTPTPAPTLTAPTPSPVIVAPTIVTPTPAIVTPAPAPAIVIPTPTPAPTLVTPAPAPAIVTPAPAPAIVTPTPAPTPTSGTTPAPSVSVVTPAPRPAPAIVTPTPAQSAVINTSATSTPVVQPVTVP